jgi:hypothetical protein
VAGFDAHLRRWAWATANASLLWACFRTSALEVWADGLEHDQVVEHDGVRVGTEGVCRQTSTGQSGRAVQPCDHEGEELLQTGEDALSAPLGIG